MFDGSVCSVGSIEKPQYALVRGWAIRLGGKHDLYRSELKTVYSEMRAQERRVNLGMMEPQPAGAALQIEHQHSRSCA